MYLRVVANPFLAFAGAVLWVLLLGEAIVGRLAGPLTPTIVLVLVGLLWVAPLLVHFHCLDCGATGRLSRWGHHACAGPIQRRRAGRPRRARGPTPALQVLLWIWGILLVGMFLHVSGLLPDF